MTNTSISEVIRSINLKTLLDVLHTLTPIEQVVYRKSKYLIRKIESATISKEVISSDNFKQLYFFNKENKCIFKYKIEKNEVLIARNIYDRIKCFEIPTKDSILLISDIMQNNIKINDKTPLYKGTFLNNYIEEEMKK